MILMMLFQQCGGLEIGPGWPEQGWLDLDTNRVVLLGVDHEIANEDLMDFNWHDVLPHTIRSHHPYRVEELMINEASDTTSFKLIDTENNRAIDMFDAGIFERWSWSRMEAKIAASVVNERMELDWNAYEKIKRQREADRAGVFKSEVSEPSGKGKGKTTLMVLRRL